MNPILFESRIFTISTLWFFVSISILIGVFIFIKIAQKSRLRIQFLADSIIPILIFSLLTGRIFAIFDNAQYYFHEFGWTKFYQIIAFWNDKEMSLWGALLGAMIIFTKRGINRQENLKKWSDAFGISLMLALTIGNLGAFFDGTNYGKTTKSSLGVIFDNPIVIYTGPIHPTQLYATIYTFILFIFGYMIYKKYKNRFDGLTFLIITTLFSLLKVVEGFFRGDLVLTIFGIRFPELCFFIIFIIGLKKLYHYEQKYLFTKLINKVKLKK